MRVGDEVLALYLRAREIRADGVARWEEQGGARAEYLRLLTQLDRALGIPVWSANFFEEREFAPLVRELEAAAQAEAEWVPLF
jgi:hypothetical protein